MTRFAGKSIVITGGTSGIGTTAILLGKAFGLTVIVTAGSEEKCARALEIGAAHAIDYKAQDFVAEVKRITGGVGWFAFPCCRTSFTSAVLPPSSVACAASLVYIHLSMEPSAVVSEFHFTG